MVKKTLPGFQRTSNHLAGGSYGVGDGASKINGTDSEMDPGGRERTFRAEDAVNRQDLFDIQVGGGRRRKRPN